MKVWIDRDTCEFNLSARLSCFGPLALTGVPDRGSIVKYEADGSETLTVFRHSDGQERVFLIIPRQMRDRVAYEGWDKFVPFEPEFRHNEGADRLKKEFQATKTTPDYYDFGFCFVYQIFYPDPDGEEDRG
jgi:hypothetical protein